MFLFIYRRELTDTVRCDDHVNIAHLAVISFILSFLVFSFLTQNSQCPRKKILLGKLCLEMKFKLLNSILLP